jgi:hypothetical protein
MDIGDVCPLFHMLNEQFMNEQPAGGTLVDAVLPKLQELLLRRRVQGVARETVVRLHEVFRDAEVLAGAMWPNDRERRVEALRELEVEVVGCLGGDPSTARDVASDEAEMTASHSSTAASSATCVADEEHYEDLRRGLECDVAQLCKRSCDVDGSGVCDPDASMSISGVAFELATLIVGVPSGAPRERDPEESLTACRARRAALDKREAVERLLEAFGRACVESAQRRGAS